MEAITNPEESSLYSAEKLSLDHQQATTNQKEAVMSGAHQQDTEITTTKASKTINYPKYLNYAKERGIKPKSGPIPYGKISLARVIDPYKGEILACRFDQDSQMLALALANGYTSVYSVSTGNLISYLDCSMSNGIPITALRWRPVLPGITTRSILVTGCADGTISHWHINSGKLLHMIQEKDNQILALDYKRDGSAFASAGKDYKIRIYDETTKAVSLTLDRAQWQYPGHCNRIFSLKFLYDEPELLISGGWDNNVHIWDLREGRNIGCIFGPSISGDSIDCKDNIILTGSCRSNDQIELWDFGTRKLIRTVDWEYGKSNDKLNVFSAQFGKKTSEYILACGGLVNEARIFDKKSDYMDFAKVTGFSKGLYSVDFAPNMEMFAVAGGEGEAHIIKLTKFQLMQNIATTENTLKATYFGLKQDGKRCFEARDEYFACLDTMPYEKENPYKCGSLLTDWRRFCEAGIRKYQVEERALNKRNESLYTQKQLDEYNKFKNETATIYTNI